MGNPAIRLAIASIVAIAAAALSVAFGVGGKVERPKAAVRAAQTGCHETLLADWSDGRIDGTYPVPCYLAALKALPADLEVYSSARDDIKQALSQRIVQNARKRTSARSLSH